MGTPIFYERKFLDQELAFELYDKGYCDQDIADRCGVGRECISRWRRRNGLPGHHVYIRDKKEKHKSTIVELSAEARKHGMTYGQYQVARKEGKL